MLTILSAGRLLVAPPLSERNFRALDRQIEQGWGPAPGRLAQARESRFVPIAGSPIGNRDRDA